MYVYCMFRNVFTHHKYYCQCCYPLMDSGDGNCVLVYMWEKLLLIFTVRCLGSSQKGLGFELLASLECISTNRLWWHWCIWWWQNIKYIKCIYGNYKKMLKCWKKSWVNGFCSVKADRPGVHEVNIVSLCCACGVINLSGTCIAGWTQVSDTAGRDC